MRMSMAGVILLGSWGIAETVTAQVTSDGTTGSVVVPINGGSRIIHGTVAGSNLFHSFTNFSPGTDNILFDLNDASYSGAANEVHNIFSRITGTQSSILNGKLTVAGGAAPNFFLLNPNGVLIGPKAKVLIPGSFFATTAESVSFANAPAFSTSDLTSDVSLIVSAPIGLNLGSTAAPITVQGKPGRSIYAFAPGASLTLLGNGVNVVSARFEVPTGQIQVGSVAENSQVNLDADTQVLTYAPDTIFRDIVIDDSRFKVDAFPNVNSPGSGNLYLQGRDISITGSSDLSSDNEGANDAGQIVISASGLMEIANSRVTASVADRDTPTSGRGGDITLTAAELVVRPTTKIGSDTYSTGSGGVVTIRADKVSLLGDSDRASTNTPSIRIVTNAFEAGQGGNIFIYADDLTMSGSVFVAATAYPLYGLPHLFGGQYGNGGNVLFDVGSLTMRDGAQAGTGSFSSGKSGDLTVLAEHIVLSDQLDPALHNSVLSVALSVSAYGSGAGGTLKIKADSLTVSGIARIDASSIPFSGSDVQYGRGGSINIDTNTLHLEEGASINAATYTDANAGNMVINADEITLLGQTNTSAAGSSLPTRLTATTQGGTGSGGSLTINAGTLTAIGHTAIAATSFSDDGQLQPGVRAGNSGNIALNVDRLEMREGAQFSTGTSSSGDAGDLTVRATEGIAISGTRQSSTFDQNGNSTGSVTVSTGLFNSAERGATGNGGSLAIETPVLRINEGGKISASTDSSGSSGSIKIRAGEIDVADRVLDFSGTGSGIVALVTSQASGDGGRIDVVSDRLSISKGGLIGASTDGTGNAGSINIQSGVINIEGVSDDGLFSSSIESSSSTAAAAGSVVLRGDRINIRNQGSVSVSNLAGGSAGNIDLISNRLHLNNGSVRAEANAGNQGNLNIESRDVLLLREGSKITTNATGTATGGNIRLNAPLIIGLENSDISANAIEGDGGNIRLMTQGLIGLAFREQLTPESDITASSKLGVSGTVTIESPNVEADSGLVQLPENLSDESSQIVAGCAAQNNSQFVSTGRGGLPNNPLQLLTSNQPWQDMRAIANIASLSNESADRLTGEAISSERDSDSVQAAELKEASEWQLTATGEIELLAAHSVENKESGCLAQNMALAQ